MNVEGAAAAPQALRGAPLFHAGGIVSGRDPKLPAAQVEGDLRLATCGRQPDKAASTGLLRAPSLTPYTGEGAPHLPLKTCSTASGSLLGAPIIRRDPARTIYMLPQMVAAGRR